MKLSHPRWSEGESFLVHAELTAAIHPFAPFKVSGCSLLLVVLIYIGSGTTVKVPANMLNEALCKVLENLCFLFINVWGDYEMLTPKVLKDMGPAWKSASVACS